MINEEVLRAWGAEWKSIRGQGTRELTLTIRSAPRETVRAIVARTAARVVEGVITETRSEKVGMCEHPEEVAVRDRARQWFRAWRRDPDWPAATWGIPRKQDRAKTEAEQNGHDIRVAGHLTAYRDWNVRGACRIDHLMY